MKKTLMLGKAVSEGTSKVSWLYLMKMLHLWLYLQMPRAVRLYLKMPIKNEELWDITTPGICCVKGDLKRLY